MTTTTPAVQALGRQLRYAPVAACEAICTLARAAGGSVPLTARALGISRRTLYRWIAEHELLGASWAAQCRNLSPGQRADEDGYDPASVDVPETVILAGTE